MSTRPRSHDPGWENRQRDNAELSKVLEIDVLIQRAKRTKNPLELAAIIARLRELGANKTADWLEKGNTK